MASTKYAVPAMRASGSSTPSNLPIDTPNCLRIKAWLPVTRAANLVPPAACAGRLTPRPAPRHSINIAQPRPAPATPPTIASSALTTTS